MMSEDYKAIWEGLSQLNHEILADIIHGAKRSTVPYGLLRHKLVDAGDDGYLFVTELGKQVYAAENAPETQMSEGRRELLTPDDGEREIIKRWLREDQDALTAANARIAELEAALKPFAAAWGEVPEGNRSVLCIHVYEDDIQPYRNLYRAHTDDLKRAAETLKGKG